MGRIRLFGRQLDRTDRTDQLLHTLTKALSSLVQPNWRWGAITTGGFCGFDAWLGDADSGTLSIDTELVQAEIKIADIGLEDLVFDAGGLKRQIRVFRLPDDNQVRTMTLERKVPLRKGSDNAIYMSMIQEDGFQVWNSPVYIFDSADTTQKDGA